MSWAETVKTSLSIREVVEHYLGYPDRNKKWLCPFHKDRHPSLCVYENNQKYKCFACGASGDVVDFAQHYLQTTQKEALKILDSEFGLGLSDMPKEDSRKIARMKQEREFEKQDEVDLLNRCKAQEKRICEVLRIWNDIYVRNRPRKRESMEAFRSSTRPTRCMWAAKQEAYCEWLLTCLRGEPYASEKEYGFEVEVLNELPTHYDEGCSAYKLGHRKRHVLEMLERGQLGLLWHSITT